MIHLCINAHLLAPPANGTFRRAGIHQYLYSTLDTLPEVIPVDWRVTILTGRGAIPSRVQADPRFKVIRSQIDTTDPKRRILWEQAVQPIDLVRHTTHGRYDLVHEGAYVAPLIMSRPFVVTVYDASFIRTPERIPRGRRIYLRLMTAISAKRARRVIAISQSTARDVETLFGIPRHRIDVAIPGVDARFQPLPLEQIQQFRAERRLPDRFLLYVGTLEPRKNLAILLKAYAGLSTEERGQLGLVLGGGRGWMTDELDRLIAEAGLPAAHLPGFIPDPDLPIWYNACEAFCYPSVYEGWGMPVTEAMACGRMPLVSQASSLPEAAGDVGMQLPPDDVEAWRNAIRKVIYDQGWVVREGQRARERALQFTWRQTATAIVTSYQTALSSANRT